MTTLLGFLRGLALLVVRICFGLLLVAHAWYRLDRLGMNHEIAFLQAHQVPQPTVLAWGALALEGIGGVLLVLGLAVPLVALGLLAENALVWWWIRRPHGIFLHNEGFELNLLQGLLALLLAVMGSGQAGLDALFTRGRRRGDTDRLPVREHP